jgi:hypothetical protein
MARVPDKVRFLGLFDLTGALHSHLCGDRKPAGNLRYLEK